MTEFRENLIDRMIALYGYENEVVVRFATYCEEWEENEWNNKMLSTLVKAHEAFPLKEEE